MGSRRLGRALVFLGILAITVSMAWWASYYNQVIGSFGEKPPLTHALYCILYTTDACAQAQAAAKLPVQFPFPPYNPLAAWFAIAILVLGLVVVARSASSEPAPVTPAGEPKLFIPKLEPVYAWTRDLSWPLIRITLGLSLFYFGAVKVLYSSIPIFAAGSMARRGLEPSVIFAYIIFFNEAIGSLLLALGLFTRFVAASIAIEFFMITFFAHFSYGFAWNNARGGWLFPLMFGILVFAVSLRGGGPYSLDRLLRREL